MQLLEKAPRDMYPVTISSVDNRVQIETPSNAYVCHLQVRFVMLRAGIQADDHELVYLALIFKHLGGTL
jgi:hypothetical protein